MKRKRIPENRKMSQQEKQKMRRAVLICRLIPFVGGAAACVAGIIFLLICLMTEKNGAVSEKTDPISYARFAFTEEKIEPIGYAGAVFTDMEIQEQFLTINEYSRPGTELREVKKIVIHYTGNPGASAQGNRDYFESLADNPITSASSHFVIGLDGEIIQCVPLDEIAYASNKANSYSISIECCHPTEEGEFTTATYNQCVALTAQLCHYYHLNPEEDVIRHYDVTGKECPRFYVDNPDEWEMFLGFVAEQTESMEQEKP